MTDIKIENGDAATDSAGSFVRLGDSEARLQRAKNALGIRRGSFIYDRSLGSRLCSGGGLPSLGEVRLAVSEALARYDDLSFEVLEYDERSVTVRLRSGDLTEDSEVCFYGEL